MDTISSSANRVRLLPLGISDFGLVIKQGCYYVDKTMFIPRLEMASSYLFLVRPRRFGKSLLLSMLKSYYDISEKDRFDEYFGRLWIGSHPTPYRNRYAVLHLDFSQVTGTIDSLEENFYGYCNYALNTFADKYQQLFGADFTTVIKADSNALRVAMLQCCMLQLQLVHVASNLLIYIILIIELAIVVFHLVFATCNNATLLCKCSFY